MGRFWQYNETKSCSSNAVLLFGISSRAVVLLHLITCAKKDKAARIRCFSNQALDGCSAPESSGIGYQSASVKETIFLKNHGFMFGSVLFPFTLANGMLFVSDCIW